MTSGGTSKNGEEPTLSVSQLARMASTTTSAINYYVRTGVLPPPVKTSRTRALYPESFVARIERIRELKERGLPLKVIRSVLDSDDPAGELGIAPARGRQRAASAISVDELLAESGLTGDDYRTLVSNGLLRPARESLHDRRDMLAARAFARLLKAGVSHKLLARHNEYEPLARAEAHFLAEHISAAGDGEETPTGTIAPAFDAVRRYLRTRKFETEFPKLAQEDRG
jgi:DNA-binding transcriptional MerR regulator